jgi:hypothetical protein
MKIEHKLSEKYIDPDGNTHCFIYDDDEFSYCDTCSVLKFCYYNHGEIKFACVDYNRCDHTSGHYERVEE